MGNGGDMRSERKVIPVIEEQVRIDKHIVDEGGVILRKEVEKKIVDVESVLSQENITIERIPIDRPVETAPAPVRYEGDTMIVSVVQEELVVQKRLILVEEIRISKTTEQKNIREPMELRREKLSIEAQDKEKKVD